jgi:hypothetical protein
MSLKDPVKGTGVNQVEMNEKLNKYPLNEDVTKDRGNTKVTDPFSEPNN